MRTWLCYDGGLQISDIRLAISLDGSNQDFGSIQEELGHVQRSFLCFSEESTQWEAWKATGCDLRGSSGPFSTPFVDGPAYKHTSDAEGFQQDGRHQGWFTNEGCQHHAQLSGELGYHFDHRWSDCRTCADPERNPSQRCTDRAGEQREYYQGLYYGRYKINSFISLLCMAFQ